MSGKAVSAVFDHSRAKSSTLIVALFIADCANTEGEHAWPAIETIARAAKVSRRSVFRCIGELVEMRELEVESKGGKHGTNSYRILLPGLCPTRHGDTDGTVPGAAHNGATGDTQLVRTGNNKETDPPSPPSGGAWRTSRVDGQPIAEPEASLAAAIIAAFNDVAGTPYSLEGKHNRARTAIVMRVREHPELTADDHRVLIETVFKKPWWDDVPHPGVVYGNTTLFERAIAKLRVRPNSDDWDGDKLEERSRVEYGDLA